MIGLSDSIAVGTNRWDASKPVYFETFLSATVCAALPVIWVLTAI